MNIKLVGVSTDELSTALKFSGLYLEQKAKGEWVIRAVPDFLLGANATQCGCEAAKKLSEVRERVGGKAAELKEQMVELGHKLTELSIRLENQEDKPRAIKPHSTLEFWERFADAKKN